MILNNHSLEARLEVSSVIIIASLSSLLHSPPTGQNRPPNGQKALRLRQSIAFLPTSPCPAGGSGTPAPRARKRVSGGPREGRKANPYEKGGGPPIVERKITAEYILHIAGGT